MRIFNIVIRPRLAAKESTTLSNLSSLCSIAFQVDVRWEDSLACGAHRSESVFSLVLCAAVGESPVLLCDPPSEADISDLYKNCVLVSVFYANIFQFGRRGARPTCVLLSCSLSLSGMRPASSALP